MKINYLIINYFIKQFICVVMKIKRFEDKSRTVQIEYIKI